MVGSGRSFGLQLPCPGLRYILTSSAVLLAKMLPQAKTVSAEAINSLRFMSYYFVFTLMMYASPLGVVNEMILPALLADGYMAICFPSVTS